MISYKKLIPFKVNCKNEENSKRLQKLLFKQNIIWNSGSSRIDPRIYLYVEEKKFSNKVIILCSNYNDFIGENKDIKEIPIEKLLASPLKIFLRKKKAGSGS